MVSIAQQESHTRIDTFLAKDKIDSMIVDCKVPIVTGKHKKIFTEEDSERPSIALRFERENGCEDAGLD